MAIWGGKTLPKELGTCRDVQGTQRNTNDYLVSLEFTGILNGHKGVEVISLSWTERRERGGEDMASHQREKGWAQEVGGRQSTTGDGGRRVVAGEGGKIARDREPRQTEKRNRQATGARGEKSF
jgi:hypothetical protein